MGQNQAARGFNLSRVLNFESKKKAQTLHVSCFFLTKQYNNLLFHLMWRCSYILVTYRSQNVQKMGGAQILEFHLIKTDDDTDVGLKLGKAFEKQWIYQHPTLTRLPNRNLTISRTRLCGSVGKHCGRAHSSSFQTLKSLYQLHKTSIFHPCEDIGFMHYFVISE